MEIQLLSHLMIKPRCLKSILTIAVCVVLLLSCISKQTISRETLLAPADSSTLYFPLAQSRQDSSNNRLDSFVNTWYSQMLFALHEPVLKDYIGGREIYRFTWLRTFHHPVSIRLEKENDRYQLFVKMCDGAGGYTPGKLITNKVISVTPRQWDTFLEKIGELDFWKAPTTAADEGGMDGSEWILEGSAPGHYHLVVRWTPGQGQNATFRQCADYLIELSSLRVPAREYY